VLKIIVERTFSSYEGQSGSHFVLGSPLRARMDYFVCLLFTLHCIDDQVKLRLVKGELRFLLLSFVWDIFKNVYHFARILLKLIF